MSSPRRALSPSKAHNIGTPLSKNSPLPSVKIPKLTTTALTPSKSVKKPKLNFTIFEDKPKQNHHHQPSEQTNRTDHNDQENILKPKPLHLQQHSHTRSPLSNLSINQFPGFIQYADGASLSAPIQLRELYHPPNYKGVATNLHKQTALPSFVTPPRRNLMHNKVYKTQPLLDDEEDEVEAQLRSKRRQLLKKKRSLSVGRNNGKLPLIRKNNFQILSA